MGRAYSRSGVGEDLADIQSLGGRLIIYGDINDPMMNYFNPSIEFIGGELKIAIRSCNFTTVRHSDWKFLDGGVYSKTDVVYGDVDPDTLGITNLHKLELENAPVKTQIAGLEDVRLFPRKDGMHAIGFEVDRVTPVEYQKSGMAEYLIKGKKLIYLRTLKKPNENIVEKNWMPANVASDSFEFTYSPTQVWTDGEVIGQAYDSEIHGGSQLIKQKDGSYLSIVHNKVRDPQYGMVYDRFVYITYLARHDENGLITELSKPFRFGTYENIEFASGMVEHGDDLIISLGVRDSKIALARIKKDILVDLLQPYNKLNDGTQDPLMVVKRRRQMMRAQRQRIASRA